MEAAQRSFLAGLPHRGALVPLELAYSEPCVLRAWHSKWLVHLVGRGGVLAVIPSQQDLVVLLSKTKTPAWTARLIASCCVGHFMVALSGGANSGLGMKRSNKDHHSDSEVTKLASG